MAVNAAMACFDDHDLGFIGAWILLEIADDHFHLHRADKRLILCNRGYRTSPYQARLSVFLEHDVQVALEISTLDCRL